MNEISSQPDADSFQQDQEIDFSKSNQTVTNHRSGNTNHTTSPSAGRFRLSLLDSESPIPEENSIVLTVPSSSEHQLQPNPTQSQQVSMKNNDDNDDGTQQSAMDEEYEVSTTSNNHVTPKNSNHDEQQSTEDDESNVVGAKMAKGDKEIMYNRFHDEILAEAENWKRQLAVGRMDIYLLRIRNSILVDQLTMIGAWDSVEVDDDDNNP